MADKLTPFDGIVRLLASSVLMHDLLKHISRVMQDPNADENFEGVHLEVLLDKALDYVEGRSDERPVVPPAPVAAREDD